MGKPSIRKSNDCEEVRKQRLWLLVVWVYARLLECGQAISKAPEKTRGWAGYNYALTTRARRPRHCALLYRPCAAKALRPPEPE